MKMYQYCFLLIMILVCQIATPCFADYEHATQDPFMTCMFVYNTRVDDVSGSVGFWVGMTVVTLGLSSPLSIPNARSSNKRYKQYRDARNLIRDAEAGWGPTVDQLYQDVFENLSAASVDASELVALIKWADRNRIFCNGKLSKYSDIREMLRNGILISRYRENQNHFQRSIEPELNNQLDPIE